MAEIASFEKALWGISVFLKVVLFSCLLYRKNHRTYPYFFAYVVLTLLHSPILYLGYGIWGFDSPEALNLAWGTQALVVAARALAVAEVCRRVMGAYRG